MRSIKQWCDHIVSWRIKKRFTTCWGNVPEKLMLTVTELSEAMEAYRKIPALIQLVLGHKVAMRKFYSGPMYQKHKEVLDNFNEELADVAIRLFDLAGSLQIDLEKEIRKKMKTNETRPQMHDKNC